MDGKKTKLFNSGKSIIMKYGNISKAYDAHKNDVNCDSHLWLYAKNHYIRTDIWEDVKLLIALRCLLEPEYVTKGGVLSVMGGIVLPYLQENKRLLEEFIGKLSPDHSWHYSLQELLPNHNPLNHVDEPYEDRVLAGYLMIMHVQKVRENDKILIPLDDPDPDLLPTTTFCKKGGKHEPGTDGMHFNCFCKKCFQTLKSSGPNQI